MARHSTTGKNVIKPKALKTRGSETTKGKRRTAPVASPRHRFSVSDLEHELQRRNEELNESREQISRMLYGEHPPQSADPHPAASAPPA